MRRVFIVCCAVSLWAAEPILHQDFSAGEQGWIAFGEGASVQAQKGALTLKYTSSPSSPDVAVLPVSNIPFSGMKSIRFEIKTDSAFAASVILDERKPG